MPWKPPADAIAWKPPADALSVAEATPDEIISHGDPVQVKRFSAVASHLSSLPPGAGVGEAAVAHKVPEADRELFSAIAAKQYGQNQTMKKAGYGTRLFLSAAEGLFDTYAPYAKMAGIIPKLDPEQERYKQRLMAIRQGTDPLIRPDTNVFGRSLQQAAQMAYPAVQAASIGKATGGAAGLAGFGKAGVGIATAVGTSGAMLPQTADQTYTSLIGEGVEPARAAMITTVSAPIEAAIESILPDPFTGYGSAFRGTARQVAAKLLKQYAVNTAKELTEEGLQKIVNETAMEVGRKMDADIPDKGLGNILMSGLQEMRDTALPLSMMVAPGAAVGAVQNARESAARPERLAQLKAIRAKGFVSAEDAQTAAIPGESRKKRMENLKQEEQQLTQEIQNEVPQAQAPEVRQAPSQEGQVPAGEVVPQSPEVPVDHHQALMDLLNSAVEAAPQAPIRKPPEVLAQGPTDITIGKPAEQPKKNMGRKPEAPQESGVSGFTTSRGSTYSWDQQNRNSQRTKSLHEEHSAFDTGLKERSARTVFVDFENAKKINDHILDAKEGGYKADFRPDKATGEMVLEKRGTGGTVSDVNRVTYSKQPAVGSYPVEIWKDGIHLGNDITDVSTKTAQKPPESLPTAPQQQLTPEPTPAVPVTPSASQEKPKRPLRNDHPDKPKELAPVWDNNVKAWVSKSHANQIWDAKANGWRMKTVEEGYAPTTPKKSLKNQPALDLSPLVNSQTETGMLDAAKKLWNTSSEANHPVIQEAVRAWKAPTPPELAKAGIAIKNTPTGWSVTGIPKEIADGLSIDYQGKKTGNGHFFRKDPTQALVDASGTIAAEAERDAAERAAGRVKTSLGYMEPETAQAFEQVRSERLKLAKEEVQNRNDSVDQLIGQFVPQGQRGQFKLKLLRARETGDASSMKAFDQMVQYSKDHSELGLPRDETKLFNMLSGESFKQNDSDILDSIDEELAKHVMEDASFDFGANEDKAPESKQTAIPGTEEAVAAQQTREEYKQAKQQPKPPKAKQKAFISGMGKDLPGQKTAFDVDGLDTPKTSLEQDAAKATQEAFDEAAAFVKKVGNTLNSGFNPEHAAGAARVVLKFARAGIKQFQVMLDNLKTRFGQPAVDQIQNFLELAWDKAQASGRFPGMEARAAQEHLTPVQQEQAVEKSQSIDPEDLTSIKKEVVSQMREKRGLPEREAPAKETVEQWAEEARITLANDPMAAIRLVNQLVENPVPITERQAILLQFHYRNLENVRNAASDEYFAAVASEDPARIVDGKTALVIANTPMTHFEESILRPAGTAWSRTGTAFQQMLRKDFSLSAVLRKGREANAGKELNEKQTVELAEMAKKMEDLRKELEAETKRREAAEAELAARRQHEQIVKEVKGENVRKKTDRRQKAEKRVEKAWAAFHRATSGTMPNVGAPITVAPHVIELAKAYVDLGVVRLGEFLAVAKERLGEKLDEAQFRAAWEKVAPEAPSLAELDTAELSLEARRLQRMLVQEGMTDRDQTTQAVHEILKAELPDLTMRQTMDALSRYGIFQVPSKNEVDKILRGMRSELLKMSQIDQQEIALARVEELRAEGKSDEEIGNALQDENLLVAATGLVRDKPTETLRKLTELYNANKASIPSTSGQREGKLSTARNAYETRLKNQIKAYEEILEKGDFAPVPKKPVRTLSDAELKLKRQYDDTRHKVLQKFAEYELAHLSPAGRLWDAIKEVSSLQRALATGFDISPFGRQGGPVAYSHPLLAANVLKEVVTELYRQTNTAEIGQDLDWGQLGKFLTGLDTRQAEFNVLHDLNDNEQGRFRLEAGLSITNSEEHATKQEEIMQGRWAKHIPGIAGSGRIGTMILNKMRATLFDLMAENIGRTGRVSMAEGKLIAQFVNMATGRVDWGPKGNHLLSNLNIGMFSARWVASRFEYLANPFLLPFRGGGLKENWRVKREIYKEYGRTFGSVSTVLGIVALAGALLWDDDDEDKPRVELGPRSPDFLKIRMGETRLDLMFGLSQVLVLSAQFASHTKKSSVIGKVKDIGEGAHPQTRLDLLAHFGRTKLAPLPGAGVTALNGMKNVVGQQETPTSLATSLLLPISLADAAKSMTDRGIPMGAAMDLLSMAGAGLNTYGPKTRYIYGTKEQREKQIQDDLKYMAWDSPERPAYSEYLTDAQLEKFAQRRQEKRGLVIFNATYAGKNEDELKTRDKNLEHLKEMRAEGVALEQARTLLRYSYKNDGGIIAKGTNDLKPSYEQKLVTLNNLFK